MSKHLCIYNQNMKLLSLYLYKEGLCSAKPMKLSLDSLKYLFIFVICEWLKGMEVLWCVDLLFEKCHFLNQNEGWDSIHTTYLHYCKITWGFMTDFFISVLYRVFFQNKMKGNLCFLFSISAFDPSRMSFVSTFIVKYFSPRLFINLCSP